MIPKMDHVTCFCSNGVGETFRISNKLSLFEIFRVGGRGLRPIEGRDSEQALHPVFHVVVCQIAPFEPAGGLPCVRSFRRFSVCSPHLFTWFRPIWNSKEGSSRALGQSNHRWPTRPRRPTPTHPPVKWKFTMPSKNGYEWLLVARGKSGVILFLWGHGKISQLLETKQKWPAARNAAAA